MRDPSTGSGVFRRKRRPQAFIFAACLSIPARPSRYGRRDYENPYRTKCESSYIFLLTKHSGRNKHLSIALRGVNVLNRRWAIKSQFRIRRLLAMVNPSRGSSYRFVSVCLVAFLAAIVLAMTPT